MLEIEEVRHFFLRNFVFRLIDSNEDRTLLNERL